MLLGIWLWALAACGAGSPAVNPAATSGPTESTERPTPVATTVPSAVRVTVEGGSYTDVGPLELAEMLKQKDFPLINVHVPYEGELPGTDALVPFDRTDDLVKQLPSDKNARVVLYCRSGTMSDIAARNLVKRGYVDVWNLKGGFQAWQQAGLPLERK